MALVHQDRLLPSEPASLSLARDLLASVADLPIISPHGHCDPAWFAQNKRFPNPAELFVIPDHYVFRMLASQGISLTELGIKNLDGATVQTDPQKIWQLFAENFHLFRGTPSQLWLNHAFQEVFGIQHPLTAESAGSYYDQIDQQLAKENFTPRALFDRFNIEVLATTEGALDTLEWHRDIAESDWQGRIITTYRPDSVIDPETPDFATNIEQLAQLSNEPATSWHGYLAAHRNRRAFFQQHGATATDHGHLTARTENLDQVAAERLFQRALKGDCTSEQADVFRGHMLTEMAKMSLDDGMTMQIHAGAYRNHSPHIMRQHGANMGFDVPLSTNYTHALRPLLDAVGLEKNLNIILFTLDESVYSRELAPLAGAYPALKLGPPWWFHDSFEGMRRFRESTTETCGFYNTAGFNDDTRAFCSIPARHDVARRTDSHYLATLVRSGRLTESDAFEVIKDLSYNLAKSSYQL